MSALHRVPALWLALNLRVGTRRATGNACWETTTLECVLGGRCAGNAEGPDYVEVRGELFSKRDSSDRCRRLNGGRRRRLRDRGVPDMANLAMLLVVRVAIVPVSDRVSAQRTHRKDERDGQ